MGALPGIKMTGAGTSAPLIVSPVAAWSAAPYNPTPSWSLGICCTVSSGASLTYSVQITCDPIPSATGNWNNHDTLVNVLTSQNGNVAFPITGIRLNVISYSSGSVNMGVALWP